MSALPDTTVLHVAGGKVTPAELLRQHARHWRRLRTVEPLRPKGWTADDCMREAEALDAVAVMLETPRHG
ncbi:MAG TPA: hypothetical protein VFW98_08395 [Gemmatimonadaceae bacterium]|nr:hypothetical protein [Gemmatimonadaceae bacterium]